MEPTSYSDAPQHALGGQSNGIPPVFGGVDTGGSPLPLPGSLQREHSRYHCYLCSRTYERQDHLSRHLKSHDNERNYRCSDCGKGFNRADLLNRHRAAHTKNGVVDSFRRRTGKACEACIRAKTRCDDERPCRRCKTRNTPCIPTEQRPQLASDGSQGDLQPSSPASAFPDDDAARAIVSLSAGDQPEQYHGFAGNGFVGDGFVPTGHNPMATANLNLGEFAYSDFFEQIMMPPMPNMATNHEPLLVPPDVSNFTQDIDLGPLDFDFTYLASGLTRPSTAQGHQGIESVVDDGPASQQKDAQLRSDALKKSPWSWNHWIPHSKHSTFFGQEEINLVEQRVNADDQLTPGSDRQFHCSIETEARDRMIRLVTQVADSRVEVPSFPSLELLEDLIDIFLLQEGNATDTCIHAASFNPETTRTELLLGMVSAGATFIALPPVWKTGLVIQEVVRMAVAKLFESDNSTTRDMQSLQAYLLWLRVGIWSGFRRKTEIAASFLQPAITILTWSHAFSRFRYKDIVPSGEDDEDALHNKWRAWIEQESFKRFVLHFFIYDSQVAIAHLKNPLISPAQMLLPLPAPKKLWRAQNAHIWRNIYLSGKPPAQSALPSAMAIAGNIRLLDELDHATDKPFCMLVACHSAAYEVFQFRQQAALLGNGQNPPRRDRWLAHVSRQKDLYDDLSTMHTYCEMQPESALEAVFTLEYLMMSLHVSLDDIQIFSGRFGEEEARRVYPSIRAWTQDEESRTTIWHAGQVLRAARSFERTMLRDFYAIAIYHCTLTLWVYGMVTSNTARKSGFQTPTIARPVPNLMAGFNTIAAPQHVVLDGEDDRTAKAFRHLGQGKPCLRTFPNPGGRGHERQDAYGYELCPLQNSKGVMMLAADLLKNNYPRSHNGLPPLVENLANLMIELSKLSGREK